MRHKFIRRPLALLVAAALCLTALPGCQQSAAKIINSVSCTVPSDGTPIKNHELFMREDAAVLPHEEAPSQETASAADQTESGTTADTADTPADSNAAGSAAPAASTMTQLHQTIQGKVSSYGGVWSVYVKRLDTGESFVINDGPMVAASLIKLYVYGAIGQAELSGQIAPGAYNGTLSPMITVSDNYSCNLLIDVLGKSTINQFIQNQGYWNTVLNRKMLSGEPVENYTSVSECGRLLEQVYYATYVSADLSARLLQDLRNQTRCWKIPAGLPGGVASANKTGELADVENDVAIVYGPSCTYILCVMSDGVAPGIAQSNIIDISSTVYYALNG